MDSQKRNRRPKLGLVWGCLLFLFVSNTVFGGIGLYKRIDLSGNAIENCRMSVGDLNGDGKVDFLFNDGRRLLKAFDHEGNELWRLFNNNDPGVVEQYHNYVISIYDIDTDSENEVICYLEIGGENCLSILNGKTGEVETSVVVPFAAPRDHEFFGLENAKMQDHIAVADLRGLGVPKDMLAIHASKMKVAAYAYDDRQLNLLWFWVTDTDGYSSGHYAYPYDIDGDGRDEVIAGVDVLDEYGQRLWRVDIYPFNPDNPNWGSDHVDAMSCADIDPERPGKELIFAAMTGVWMYAPDGTLLWHYPTKVADPQNGIFEGEGIQEVLVGNFRPDLPGLEMIFYAEDMYTPNSVSMFDKDGNALIWDIQKTGPRRSLTYAIDWDGDRSTDEIYTRTGIFDGYFNKVSESYHWSYPKSPGPDEFPPIVCDVQGDHREEILWYDTNEILIIQNTDPLAVEPLASPWTDVKYRLRYANNNHCNAIYFDWTALQAPVESDDPSVDDDLFARLLLGKPSVVGNRIIPVTLTTSKDVVQVPGPAVLTESDATETQIAFEGGVPGNIFTGTIQQTSDLAEGPATVRLAEHSLVGHDGRTNHVISEGDSLFIDRTPPQKPAQFDVK